MRPDFLKNIESTCPRPGALLGLDIGKKTIGLALSSPDQSLATPVATIKRTKFSKDVQEIQKYVQEFEVQGFIIGLPLSKDGEENKSCQSIRDFALEFARVQKEQGGPQWIAFQDEYLSTVSVEQLVDNFVEKRKTKVNAKASGLTDKLAAQKILQSALDTLNAPKT